MAAPHVETAVQSPSTATAADVGASAVVNQQQQQQSSEQKGSSSDTTGEAAQHPAGSTAYAAAGDQAWDRSQHMQHGIPGFGAMSPAQQSATILAKWGMTPSPELQMQLQMQQSQQSQQQQQPQTHHTQLQAVPSHTDAPQQGSLIRLALAANPPDSVTASPDRTVSAGLGDISGADVSSLHPARTDGSQDRTDRIQDEGRQLETKVIGWDAALHVVDSVGHVGDSVGHVGDSVGHVGDSVGHVVDSVGHVGDSVGHVVDSQAGKQQQVDAEGSSVLASEHNGIHEGGLALEQPDGEGCNPSVAPEVVRGRVARATEMWHRQRIQQEARQQVTDRACPFCVSIHSASHILPFVTCSPRIVHLHRVTCAHTCMLITAFVVQA